ncbi:hypothetical protein V5F41_12310 [Xanthobacter autotrophicus]|uniref:hypothetical protein n=1 Tax=Xanthobacter autotrophicus TaxID=280 RepID=UPI003727C639
MPTIETLPDGSKRVTLTRPLVTHEGETRAIVLREPSYGDFMALGDPTAMVLSVGSALPQDDMAVIRGYIERCANVDPLLLDQIKVLADAMALAEAVKGFFTAASAAVSKTSPTPSSSNSAGPSPTSAT